LKKLWLFTKWFFGIRGAIGHPWLANQYVTLLNYFPRLNFVVTEHKCPICGQDYWSYLSKKPKTCMRWKCYRGYYAENVRSPGNKIIC